MCHAMTTVVRRTTHQKFSPVASPIKFDNRWGLLRTGNSRGLELKRKPLLLLQVQYRLFGQVSAHRLFVSCDI